MNLQKPMSRAAEKRDRTREKAAQWARIKRLVKVRDGFRCRACGARDGLDGHHMKLRSALGEDSTQNVVCLCRVCHGELHAYRLFIHGDNADEALTFFRASQ